MYKSVYKLFSKASHEEMSNGVYHDINLHNHDVLDSNTINYMAGYIVNDLEKARSFFEEYLGAKSNNGYHNKTTDFRSYFLSFDDGARLEIMNKPQMLDQQKELNRRGYIHIAFSVGRKEKVDSLTAKLREASYEVLSGPRTTGDGYYESCVVAIEGNQIEITV